MLAIFNGTMKIQNQFFIHAIDPYVRRSNMSYFVLFAFRTRMFLSISSAGQSVITNPAVTNMQSSLLIDLPGAFQFIGIGQPDIFSFMTVSYTHLTLPTIYSV